MSERDNFNAILASGSFDKLEPYKESSRWNSLTNDDRELLGILFIKQGEHQLGKGDSNVIESFDLAGKIAPNSPLIFYKQALVYAAQGQNIRCLIAAAKALEKATDLDPNFDAAWQSWGNILVRTGLVYDDANYFIKADEKFKQAEKVCREVGLEPSLSLFWNWGVCSYRHGVHSGEAADFFTSLEKFRKAESCGLNLAEFHNDFGNVLADLACLLGKDGFLMEASEHYEKATILAPENYESLLNLACTYQRLYDFTGGRDYFSKADSAFTKASKIKNEEASLWLRWAELYVQSGKISQNVEKIEKALEKFKVADTFEENNPMILLRFGEAELLAASFKEDLELLKDAETKIVSALTAIPEQPEAWYIYGMCLSELGRYFSESSYYIKAIERFNHGLNLKGEHPLLLHGLALAHFSLGELNEDIEYYEKAIACCNKVADLGGRLFPQFLSDWGVALMKLGEMTNDRSHVEEAAAKFEQAISGRLDSLESDDVELEWLYNYGCALDFLGDFHDEAIYYEKAIQILAHVIKIDPEYYHARYNLALSFSHLGELNSDVDCFLHSLELFQQIVNHDPEDETAWNDYGLALINLGVLTSDPTTSSEVSRSYFEQSESKFLQAVALGSQHAFYNLACLYALTYNTVASLHYLERAEQSDALPPIDDVIHDVWMDNLRDEPAYRAFIARLLNDDSNQEF